MTPCKCHDVKSIVICELNRGDGPCLTERNTEPLATPEPHALNSDALTSSLAAALGGTINL